MITTLVTQHAVCDLHAAHAAPTEPNYQIFENQIKSRAMIRQFDFEDETS